MFLMTMISPLYEVIHSVISMHILTIFDLTLQRIQDPFAILEEIFCDPFQSLFHYFINQPRKNKMVARTIPSTQILHRRLEY